MIAKIKTTLIITAIAVAVVGYQHYRLARLQSSVITLTSNNAQLTQSVDEQSNTIDALESNLAHTIDNNNRLAKRLGVINNHRRAQVRELNQYRGRLNEITIAKPTLIERRANVAFRRVVRELGEAVGD